jgi:hypothetical protein
VQTDRGVLARAAVRVLGTPSVDPPETRLGREAGARVRDKDALPRDSRTTRHATVDGVSLISHEKRANSLRHSGWGAGQLQLGRCKPMLL